MASIRPRSGGFRARIHRPGQKHQSKTFPTKAEAAA